jgi:hypothetical protein
VLSTAGASILAVGYLLPAIYLLWSLKYGAIAGANPWQAAGLEWKYSLLLSRSNSLFGQYPSRDGAVVERAVRKDIDFGRFKDTNSIEMLIEVVDLSNLGPKLLFGMPAAIFRLCEWSLMPIYAYHTSCAATAICPMEFEPSLASVCI